MLFNIITPTLSNPSIKLHPIIQYKKQTEDVLHVHDECELYMEMETQRLFWVNEKDYLLNKGDIIFINGKTPHRSLAMPDSAGFLMQTGIDFNPIIPDIHLHHFVNRSSCDAAVFKAGSDINNQIQNCINDIAAENTDKRKSYDMFIKISVFKIFAILYRNNILKDPQSYFNMQSIDRIMPVLSYIDTHFAEDISLEQMSALVNLNKSHFCRIFKKTTKSSLMQYINFIRVCKAEKLLLTTDKAVLEIAEETGFASPAYFTKTFKTITGCTPSQYKKIKLINEL